MAFADPISITINGSAKSLAKINQDNYSSEYFLREAGREFRLKIRHTTIARAGVRYDRHSVELTERIYEVVGTSPEIFRKSYNVMENLSSDVVAGFVKTSLGHIGFLTEPNLTKLVNFES